ncbi:MAG TPA: MarR family transcriptional regulator [Acidimicrobiia bacterium]|nr:MarR family transcriptional regulator [Acidimicrobiia bacterium]
MKESTETDLETAARLRLAVARLQRLLRSQEMGGLSLTEASCLAVIGRRGPMPLNEIATSEHLSAPSVTKTITRMEEAGLIDRLTDPTDRRVSLVTLSRKGRALLDQIRSRRNAFLLLRLQALSPSDLEAVEQALPILERLSAEALIP